MQLEIERKFLVKNDSFKNDSYFFEIRQGYLCSESGRTERVRVMGKSGFITIKGKTTGITREEFEYEIPAADAHRLLDTLCIKPIIEKKRYFYKYEGLTWVIDEFFGENEGLVVAEVELDSEEQVVQMPDWVGLEVTGQPKYNNSSLIKMPYCKWQ
jgi:CYTH domain-containing protein